MAKPKSADANPGSYPSISFVFSILYTLKGTTTLLCMAHVNIQVNILTLTFQEIQIHCLQAVNKSGVGVARSSC